MTRSLGMTVETGTKSIFQTVKHLFFICFSCHGLSEARLDGLPWQYSYSDKNTQRSGWEEPTTVNFSLVSLALVN